MFELRCRDVGFDCAGVVRSMTKEAVLQQAADHAVSVHGVEVTPALAATVMAAIQVCQSSGPEALPASPAPRGSSQDG